MEDQVNSESVGQAAPVTRAGHVALVGRPNVGKSTLLNALVGEKLSIVTPKAQTTRESVTGILTTASCQAIFVDTPGLLEPRYTLQRAMHETALEVIADADMVLLLLDATRPEELPPTGPVLDAIRRRRDAMVVIVNKIDEGTSEAVEALNAWSRDTLDVVPRAVSAVRGDGVNELRAAIEAGLPESPFYYPADELAVQPVRFFVTELIRETIFEMYEQEIPYSSIVRVEEYREADDPVFIRATLYLERESQKPIVIGKGGAGIRELGSRSREKIESFIGERVYLDLFVKTLPNWRSKVGTLRYLGYRLPPSMAHEDADDPGPRVKTDAAGSSAQRGKSAVRGGQGGGRHDKVGSGRSGRSGRPAKSGERKRTGKRGERAAKETRDRTARSEEPAEKEARDRTAKGGARARKETRDRTGKGGRAKRAGKDGAAGSGGSAKTESGRGKRAGESENRPPVKSGKPRRPGQRGRPGGPGTSGRGPAGRRPGGSGKRGG